MKHLNPSVFINAPLDVEYAPLMDALVFTSVCCGFLPRSALETGSTGIARLDRILTALSVSEYSFHDLSRCRGGGDLNFARFNMPLELGMAITRAHFSSGSHEWFAMVVRGHDYSQYASDLLGFDLKAHRGTAESIVPPYMAWLLTRDQAVGDLTPRDVLVALPAFRQSKKALADKWSDEIPWRYLVRAACDCADPDDYESPIGNTVSTPRRPRVMRLFASNVGFGARMPTRRC
jgi:hypothetical protein